MSSESGMTENPRIGNWTLGRIAEAVGGALDGESGAAPAGVSTDTRSLDAGELFVALRGPNFDGHDFVEEAARNGAVGAVVFRDFAAEGEFLEGVPLIRVDDTREALAELGRAIWREAREEGLHTIDLTGSNGKTTTKEMLAAIWSTRGEVYSTPGNFNNEIGLPLTLCGLPERCDHLVLEMGANARGEIAGLIRLAPGDERLITSIGLAHTEGFGSVDGIRRAKSEIFEAATSGALAVVPASERSKLRLEAFPGEVWTFGEGSDADLRLVEYSKVEEGSGPFEAVLEWRDRRICIELDLPGRHNGRNLACALSTLVARGRTLDVESLEGALREMELPGGRWNRTRREDLSFIDDAYNANPSSVRASFEAFLEVEPDADFDAAKLRRVAVLGEMHELGDEAPRLHREVAGEIAGHSALDAFCAVGEFSESMARAARRISRGDLEVAACRETEEVAEWLLDRRPAFVWMKASRGCALERVIEAVTDDLHDG